MFERRSIFLHLGRGVESAGVIIDAEAAAGVDGLKHDAFAPELLHQLAHALDGRAERVRRANLRADVNADAMRLEPAVVGRALVNAQRAADVDAELVLAQAGGDVGMRVGKDIGIDAQREAGADFEFARAGREQLQLRLAFHVELQNAGLEREVDLRGGFSHAGKDHAAGGIRRGGQHALQFAAGDDVETGAVLAEKLENGQRGVGLDRVADKMLAAGESLLKKRAAARAIWSAE